MYNSFIVRNFRGFRELKIDHLDRINLITGKNNVGKTALLEALFLYCGAYNPQLAINLNAFRGITKMKLTIGQWDEIFWNSLFNQFDTSRDIELVGNYKETTGRILWLRIVKQPSHPELITQSVENALEVSKGVISSSEVTRLLELEYKEAERHGKHYLIFDTQGIRMHPLPPPPPFPAYFQGARIIIPFSEEAERFGQLEIHGNQDVLLDVLQIIEPRIKRLAMIVIAGQPILHGDIGMGRLMPLPVMGEGMARLTSLVLQIANAPKGVVLVDEIENGIHHSKMLKVWEAIAKVARKFDTQIFATTHSLECIVSAHNAFKESDVYDFCLHRLDYVKDAITHVSYDKETLEAAIETELEIR
jgi:hypothetical protein